jgi:hypothetical protein
MFQVGAAEIKTSIDFFPVDSFINSMLFTILH